MRMPTYKVSVSNQENEAFDIKGYPECKQYGALFFMNDHGEILKIFAPGTWTEVTLIESHRDYCPTCGKPR